MRTGQLAPRRPSCRHRRGRRWNLGSPPALPGVEGQGPRLTGGDSERPGESDRRRGDRPRVTRPCGPGGCAERRPSPGRAGRLRGYGPWMRRQRRGTAGAWPRPGEEAASGATAAAAASEEEGSPPRARPSARQSSQLFLLGLSSASRCSFAPRGRSRRSLSAAWTPSQPVPPPLPGPRSGETLGRDHEEIQHQEGAGRPDRRLVLGLAAAATAAAPAWEPGAGDPGDAPVRTLPTLQGEGSGERAARPSCRGKIGVV